MLALINQYTSRVWSLHQTRAQMETALGRFILNGQFCVQHSEGLPVKLWAVRMLNTRHIGDKCTKEDFIIISSHSEILENETI